MLEQMESEGSAMEATALTALTGALKKKCAKPIGKIKRLADEELEVTRKPPLKAY